MSIEKVSLILHHAPVKESKKLLLIGIANHEGDGGAWPAIDTLARYANIHRRNVRKQLEELEEEGYIEIVSRPGMTSYYFTRVECPDDCDRTSNHRVTQRASATPGATATPGASAPPTQRASAPPTQRASAPRTVIEPSYEPSLNTLSVEKIFEEFIAHYPRKSDRASAWSLFAKFTAAQAVDVVNTLHDWLASDEYPEPKYRPYAANWLERGYHQKTYQRKTAETTVAQRAKEIRERNTQAPVENVEDMVECEHGKTGYCPTCYHNAMKGSQ